MHPLVLLVFAAASALTLVSATEPGTRLHVSGVVRDQGGHPVAGAVIHIYQTDSSGRYTLERAMDEPHARLSGTVTTAGDGTFELRTIRPGGYPKAVPLGGQDRHIPAHIHMDVSAPGHAGRRLQVVFSDDPLFADPYWKRWAADNDHPTVTVVPAGNGVDAKLTITLQ